MNKLRIFLKISLLTTFFYLLSLFCNQQTDSFSVQKITTPSPLSFENVGEEQKAFSILNQPFYYLGTGGQTFVFASKDGKYVLKFFKNIPHPLVFLKKYKAKKKQKLLRDLKGYLLAFQKAPQETALLFLKMDSKTPFNQTIQLQDKLKISHLISLQNTLFVLQRRAIPFEEYPPLQENPKKVFNCLFEFAKTLDSKNLTDADFIHLDRNLGFLDDKPLFIDPGKFLEYSDPSERMSKKFMQWIEKKHPGIISSDDSS